MGVKTMQIPGTNLEITSKVDRVYITHDGVAKRVKFTGKSFKNVMEEVQRFAYLRGFNVPATILKFILKRIGLPEVDRIPGEEQLTKDDLLELSRALIALDSLKCEYLSPLQVTEVPEEIKKGVLMPTPELADIAPELADIVPEIETKQNQSVWDIPLDEEVTGLIYSFHGENIPTNTPTPRTESKSKTSTYIWDDAETMDQLEDLAKDDMEPIKATSELLNMKVVFLGERGVGVKSILFECNLKVTNDDTSCSQLDQQKLIESNIVSHNDMDFRIDACTFPQSLDNKVSKTEFYAGTGIVVLVYSVAERWSFDSLDFWIREVTNSFLIPPPIIIVGNKTDLRDHPVFDDEDEFDTPVTTEEGQEFCEKASKRIAGEHQVHPVFFVETSSVSGQGITILLEKIIDFWLANERPSMPAVEEQVPVH